VAIVVVVVASTTSVTAAHAGVPQAGVLSVNDAGGNGAITGSVVDGVAGEATIRVTNSHDYWTNLDVSTVGVTLELGPFLQGGLYASSGVLGPGATAVWFARYDKSKPAQVFVRATPYLLQTRTGGLAAAFNILNIAASMLSGSTSRRVGLVVDSPGSLTQAANLVEAAFGDRLATEFTVRRWPPGRRVVRSGS
jgi:hypothetical protein